MSGPLASGERAGGLDVSFFGGFLGVVYYKHGDHKKHDPRKKKKKYKFISIPTSRLGHASFKAGNTIISGISGI